MTSVYNQLYNNDAYCTLARAIADRMGVNYDSPNSEYLDVMVAIQDKAIGYSLLEPAHFPMVALRICYHKEIYQHYLEFMGVYAQYYRDKTQ